MKEKKEINTIKKITLLGSTGSIGQNALDVIRSFKDSFSVVGLAAHSNIELLKKQINEFKPKYVAVYDVTFANKLKKEFKDLTIFVGKEGLKEITSIKVDIILSAIVGAVGLEPLLAGIAHCNTVAIANKEPLVMAGGIIVDKAKKESVELIPVDSEHSAIFQCLLGQKPETIEKIYLTASGGPFYKSTFTELDSVTPDDAIKHPTWNMGKKISVDSATLMNKGLEIIEAMWLFHLDVEKIDVVIHPQSIIHGLVEFTDGNILAHLGPTDMKLPILFSFTYPERAKKHIKRLNLFELSHLSFDVPDTKKFPCLDLARTSAKQGGVIPAVLNAANEVAVHAFCNKKITFKQIPLVIEKTLNRMSHQNRPYTLESILQTDEETRIKTNEIINQLT
ncbi:MAG TPA: 1-deoxy-D-xylulose-5-phosphate reductoisomerase [Candidatus Hydrogenedens sp.]|nr:1-deoxy-D-xylulose-5-phosphate reductoisomerase [Candidatus Hydrogenedens sp.]HPP59154.1 1-deoxy-D-xylulose-5-phosphate reductoisomerase [Candidatus Hydrogenedens sp.]